MHILFTDSQVYLFFCNASAWDCEWSFIVLAQCWRLKVSNGQVSVSALQGLVSWQKSDVSVSWNCRNVLVSCRKLRSCLQPCLAAWPQYYTWAENRGGCCAPFYMGELGPHQTQCRLGRGRPPYQVASWSIQPLGHNRHGPKIGDCNPFEWPGPRPTSIPTGIVIHPTVSPQYTNVTDRQTDRQRSDSIRRTVLEMVQELTEKSLRYFTINKTTFITLHKLKAKYIHCGSRIWHWCSTL